MLTCGNSCDIKWEISVLRETENGLLLMSPNGDLQWMSHTDYEIFVKQRKLRSESIEDKDDN